MSSGIENSNLSSPSLPWLEEPDFGRKARAIVVDLVRRYQLSDTPDDLYQVVVMRLLRYFKERDIRQIGQPLAFFYTVARREAIRIFNAESRFSSEVMDDVENGVLSDNLEHVRQIESCQLMREVMSNLDEEERAIFTLWVSEGYSSREIAARLAAEGRHMSHVTVTTRVASIRKKIADLLFADRLPSLKK